MDTDESLDRAIERMAAASNGFVNGDPGDFVAIWSRGDDVTIFGGFGSGERGRDQIVSRLEWASARFHSGEVAYEPITSGQSGDLAYAVGIERGHVTLVGEDRPSDLTLRVTHLFRQEHGGWKLIHRHADPITSVTAPGALLQEPKPGTP